MLARKATLEAQQVTGLSIISNLSQRLLNRSWQRSLNKTFSFEKCLLLVCSNVEEDSVNSKGSTCYTKSCTGTFLGISLWAVTWGVDCEMPLLGPIQVQTWNNSLPATSCVQTLALYFKAMSTATQRRQEVLPQHKWNTLCTSRVCFSTGKALTIQVSLSLALGTLGSLSSQLTTK